MDGLTSEQKVRLCVHRCARSVCADTCGRLSLQLSPAAADLIAELVYKKLKLYALDLEAFAKHAKRNTINSEDVRLLVRRNPSLKSHMGKLAETCAVTTKRRKTVSSNPVAAIPAPAAAVSTALPVSPGAPKPGTSKEQDMEVEETIDLTFTCNDFV